MKVFQYTGAGKRESNQDFALARQFDDERGVFVLADGMGGYSNGAEAAQLVATAITNFVSSNLNLQPDALLRQAVIDANEKLSSLRYAYGCVKMGAVIAVVLVLHDKAYCTWLGDSRIYHFRKDQLLFMSDDHSAVNEWRAKAVLTPNQIEKYSSMVTRCVMGDNRLGAVEVHSFDIEKDDVIILCSDGLHKKLNIALLPESFSELNEYLSTNNDSFDDNYTIIKLFV